MADEVGGSGAGRADASATEPVATNARPADADAADGPGAVPEAPQDRAEGVAGVLDALEDVVAQARAMPMSSSVLVNRAEVLDLVAQVREALPEELGRAQRVLAGADDVLAEARAAAEAVVATARERAAELVSGEQVALAAQARAREVVAEAEQTAAALRLEADDYCDRRLADLEIDLGRVLAQVQAGRARLAARLAASPPPDDDA